MPPPGDCEVGGVEPAGSFGLEREKLPTTHTHTKSGRFCIPATAGETARPPFRPEASKQRVLRSLGTAYSGLQRVIQADGSTLLGREDSKMCGNTPLLINERGLCLGVTCLACELQTPSTACARI